MSTDPARSRYFTIQAVRAAGVIQVLLALLILSHRLEWPEWVGYLLFVNGFIDVFAIPIMLARRWKSPKP
jgi:hypothetical protein